MGKIKFSWGINRCAVINCKMGDCFLIGVNNDGKIKTNLHPLFCNYPGVFALYSLSLCARILVKPILSCKHFSFFIPAILSVIFGIFIPNRRDLTLISAKGVDSFHL